MAKKKVISTQQYVVHGFCFFLIKINFFAAMFPPSVKNVHDVTY